MKTVSKSPYELRLELLQLAFEILTAKHAALAGKNADGPVTSSPTTEEVIVEAEKLNVFMSTSSNH